MQCDRGDRGVAEATVSRALLALVLVGLFAAPARAADIDPDRPELTESAKLLRRGFVQLESGLAFSRERRDGFANEKTFEAAADLRIGLLHDVELNLSWEPLVSVWGREDAVGVGDVTLGVRYRFVEGIEDEPWPPHVAVKVFAKLPAMNEPIGTGRPDFGVLLLASFELPNDFELEVNVGAAAVGQPRSNRFLGQAIATASLSRDITQSMLGFLELLFNSRQEEEGREYFAVNVGLVYRLTRNLAIDAGFQTLVAGRGPDYVARTGLSVLWR
jgi:hypothetical protein